MASVSSQPPLQASSPPVKGSNDGLQAPHSHSSPEHMLPSSPLLRDVDSTPSRLQLPVSSSSERTSRASSIRLSRDLGTLRWDGESVAESDLNDDSVFGDISDTEGGGTPTNGASNGYDATPDTDRHETEQLNSYSALSKRADFILASAKRKLSLLEGDIKGARHSLASPIMPAYSPSTPVTPSNSVHRIPGEDEEKRLSTRGPRINFGTPRNTFVSGVDLKGHSRVFSETSVPSPRGAAIKGSLGLEHVRNQRPLHSSLADRSLGPVIEGEVSTEYPSDTNGVALSTENNTNPSTAAKVLRDEADDVRDRLSEIQERLKQSSDRRRSSRESAIVNQIQALEKSLEQQEEVLEMLEQAEVPKEPLNGDPRVEWHQILERSDSQEDDYDSSDEYNDDPEFHSVLEEQLLEEEYFDYDGAHEDRADAFDYEHFILHSVLGNYSLSAAEERPSSSGSTSSNSTARGNTDDNPAGNDTETERLRHNQSVASFATAHSRTGEDYSESDNLDAAQDSSEDIEGTQRPMRRSAGEPRQPSTIFSDSSTPTPLAGSSSGSDKGGVVGHRPASRIFAALAGPESKSSRLAPLGEDDVQLVYSLAEAMRRACLQLRRNAQEEDAEAREWRGRVEEARKILVGERDLTLS